MKRKNGAFVPQNSSQQQQQTNSTKRSSTTTTTEQLQLPRTGFLPPIDQSKRSQQKQQQQQQQHFYPTKVNHNRATSPSTTSSSPAVVAPEEAIRWTLPETSKNFSKVLKKTIQAKLEAARSSNEVQEVLDRRCRVIIHERVLARAITNPTPVDDEGNPIDVNHIVAPLSALQRQQYLKEQSEKESERANAARERRYVSEQSFFEYVTRSCDDPQSVDAQFQRRKQWRVAVLTSFLFLRNIIAAAGGAGGDVGARARNKKRCAVVGRRASAINEAAEAYWRNRPLELLPPPPSGEGGELSIASTRHLAFATTTTSTTQGLSIVSARGKQMTTTKVPSNARRGSRAPVDSAINELPSSVSPAGSLSPSPSPVSRSRHRGWALYRASVVLKWICKVSRKNVAVDRIVNMIRGAQRMAKFHQAMGVFRRKLLSTQRLVRDHLSLLRSRHAIFEVAWERNTAWVKDYLLQHFDPVKKCRKAIAKAQDEVAAAQRHADRVAIAEASAQLEQQHEAKARGGTSTPPTNNAIVVPAAAFLLAENSFMFAQNFMHHTVSMDHDGPDWLNRNNTSNGSVDLSFDDSAGGMSSLPRLRRSQSIVADDAVWRPLEFKRRQSMAVHDTNPIASPPPALSSPVDSGGVGGSGSGSHASSPTSPTLSRTGGGGGDFSAPKMDIVRLILDGSIPDQRKDTMMRRLKAHLHEFNQLHNDAYISAMHVYNFDRAEYLQKRKAGKAVGMPVPRQPRPRFRSAVSPAHLMRALLVAEWEELIMRTMAKPVVVTSPTLSSPTSRFPPQLPQPQMMAPPLHIPFPPQLDDHKLAIHRFRLEGKQIAKRRREIAAETRRREELLREVEPAEFPAVSRRDTIRMLVMPKQGD